MYKTFSLFVLTSSLIISQEIFETVNADSRINAISNPGMLDDGLGMCNPPLISVDLNNNGMLDYVTAHDALDLLYIFFDHYDFTEAMYYPHEGPNLIVTGASFLGSSFVGGDFNGDGIDDLLVGASAELGEGESYVIFGDSDLPTSGTYEINSLMDLRLRFSGFSGNNDLFGYSVASADMNNDGYDEIIVGATVAWYQGDGSGRGSVYVIYGSDNLPEELDARTESDIVIEGVEPYDHIGRYIRKGDFNNDSYEDIVFTSAYWDGPGPNVQKGKVWILYGGNSLSNFYSISNSYDEMSTFTGSAMNDNLAFAGVGDINGDNVDDLLLGAGSYLSPYNLGRLYINYGPINPGVHYDDIENFPYQTQITGDYTYQYLNSRFGQNIATYDINSDGFDDVLLGAHDYSRQPYFMGASQEGGASIIFGSNSLENFTIEDGNQDILFLAPTSAIHFGRGVSFIESNNNKLYASIVDGGASIIYLFELPYLLNLNKDITIPITYKLKQNYPNPFNPTTQIKYDLPEDAMVNITIYDLMGRSIKLLINSQQTAGYKSIQWNATNNQGKPVSAGLYLYTIEAGEFRQTKKMVLLK